MKCCTRIFGRPDGGLGMGMREVLEHSRTGLGESEGFGLALRIILGERQIGFSGGGTVNTINAIGVWESLFRS